MKTWWVKKIAKGIVIALFATTLISFIVMQLWNALIPSLFSGPQLSFWQSAGLLLLSHILLRGWGPWRHGGGWHRDRWRRRFEEKLAAMTPEEREKYKEGWRGGCGHSHQEKTVS